ncbi:MAG: fimbrial protein [Acinetobacter sp.]
MSKLSLVALIACAVSIPSAMAKHVGPQNTGTVYFEGKVFHNSCKVENKGNINVTLNPILNTKINDGEAEQIQKFSIMVKDCYIDENWTPQLSWVNNSALTTSEGYLKNTLFLTGSNAALVLKDNGGKNINLRTTTQKYPPLKLSKSRDNQTLEYAFQVGYIKSKDIFLSGPIRSGVIQTQATFSITYDL